MNGIDRFNIRVYGLLEDKGRVLVSDEVHRGLAITKFPGGGLEFGEGLLDGLRREFQEELGIDVLRAEHFHTTDHFQRSAFRASDQVVSVYYKVWVQVPQAIPIGVASGEGGELFRWLDLATAPPEAVTLPIDRIVLQALRASRT